MSYKYDVKSIEHSSNNYLYLNFSTNNNNPIEIEKDLEDIKLFLKEKWFTKKLEPKVTFKEWLKSKLL